MPRVRRYIESGAVYELCFRAKSSLPLIPRVLINFMIRCTIARAQRDEKVILCHDIWNGSHPHLIVVAKDASQLLSFCAEIQRKITEFYKRLLGLRYLNIWEGTPSVIKIGDLKAGIERIAYLYANPAQDDLEDSIEQFPGVSSWESFQQCLSGDNAETVEQYPWIRSPLIPEASSGNLSKREELQLLKTLQEKNTELYPLIREPNAWMKSFGVTDTKSIEEVNRSILLRTREREAVAREKRKAQKRKCLGAVNLALQPLLRKHSPKKKERRIYIITTLKEVRLQFAEKLRKLEFECKRCLAQWRKGNLSMKWPIEAFKPPLPPLVSVFAT